MFPRSSLALLAGLCLVAAARPAEAQATFDHSAFDALLKKHVVDGMVDYDAFKGSAEFQRYLASLAAAQPGNLPEAERLAYWINVYNAYTIQLINSHGERDSIRNINKSLGLSLKGPWKEKLVKAGGRTLHLDNVEQDIIRKEFLSYPGWQRIHFALVCAAMGCPVLRSEAYTGARLDTQLDEQAKLFLLRQPDKNRVDAARGVLHASPIMSKWYREDFGGSDAEIAKWLSRFWPDGPEKQLLASGRVKVEETDYDWTLNSQAKAAAKGKAAGR